MDWTCRLLDVYWKKKIPFGYLRPFLISVRHENPSEMFLHIRMICFAQPRMISREVIDTDAADSGQKKDSVLLIGRERELAAILKLLKQDGIRMLTLTGTAGIGKTLLAVAAADIAAPQYVQVVFADLSPLKEAGQVLTAAANAIGIREHDPASLAKRLCTAIGLSKTLLVLDNCEHVLGCKKDLDILMEECPNLKILATSRERLRSKHELIFPVGPLRLPGPGCHESVSELSGIPSIALFVRQVQNKLPDFALSEENAAVAAELCGHLDGIPLAIKLAAGRAETPGLSELLDLVKSGKAASDSGRRGMIGPALDWSFSLLSGEEKALFRRLSVFQGPWSLQEAVGVCAGGSLRAEGIPILLARLSDASLIQVDRKAGQGKRYRFLETVKAYAHAELLASGERNGMLKKHRDWFLVWAEQGETGVWGPEIPELLDQLESNYNDLWAAMEWCRDTKGEAAGGLRIWAAMVSYYDLRGRVAEGVAMSRQLLARTSALTPTRARTLLQTGVLLRSQGDLAGAGSVVAECLSFAFELGDTFDAVAGLCTQGSLCQIRGNDAEAEETLKMALAQAQNCFESEPRVLYIALFWLGSFHCFQGRCSRAVPVLEQALAVARQQGCILFEARILAVLGRALIGTGAYERAEAFLTEGMSVARKLKYHEITALCLVYLGQAARAKNHRAGALRFLAAAQLLLRYAGVVYWFPDRDFSRMISEVTGDELDKALPPDCILPEQVSAWALETLGVGAKHEPMPASDGLTMREREVCSLVVKGLGNREIASQLRISRRTVDAHIRHILVKLDLKTRAQISAWYALRRGAAQ